MPVDGVAHDKIQALKGKVLLSKITDTYREERGWKPQLCSFFLLSLVLDSLLYGKESRRH